MRVSQVSHAHIMSMFTIRGFLFNNFIILITFVLVAGRLAVVLLGLALDLLHLGPLVLEPHLHHPDAEAGLLGQGFPDFPARLRTDFEGGLELPPLRRREDGPGSLRPPPTVPRSAVLVQQVVVSGAGLLHEVHLLLEVLSAEELAGAQNELFALLQRLAAHHAHETRQVEDVLLGSHHHLVRQQPVAASRAFYPEYPAKKNHKLSTLLYKI